MVSEETMMLMLDAARVGASDIHLAWLCRMDLNEFRALLSSDEQLSLRLNYERALGVYEALSSLKSAQGSGGTVNASGVKAWIELTTSGYGDRTTDLSMLKDIRFRWVEDESMTKEMVSADASDVAHDELKINIAEDTAN